MSSYEYKRQLWWYKVRWAALGAASGALKSSLVVAFAAPDAMIPGPALYKTLGAIAFFAGVSAFQSVMTFIAQYPAPPPEEETTTVTETVTSSAAPPTVTQTVTTTRGPDPQKEDA
jgi:hypothetical protein